MRSTKTTSPSRPRLNASSKYLIHTRRIADNQKKELRNETHEGLDGRVWGHWSVRGDAFCEPALSLPSRGGRAARGFTGDELGDRNAKDQQYTDSRAAD